MTTKAKSKTDAEAMMTDLQSAGLGPTAWMGTTWVQAMSDLSSEVMKFVTERVEKDVRTQHEILHCKDIKELQAIQSRFLSDAMADYTAQTGKLVGMSDDLFSGAAKAGSVGDDDETSVDKTHHSTPV